MLAPVCDASTGATTTPDDGMELTAPDWDRLWGRLLAASSVIDVTRRVLTQLDSGLRSKELGTDLRKLEERLNGAYELCCTAARLDGLAVPTGIDLADLERQLATITLSKSMQGCASAPGLPGAPRRIGQSPTTSTVTSSPARTSRLPISRNLTSSAGSPRHR